MTKEEMIAAIQQVGTCENDTERLTLLSDLQDGLTSDYDSLEAITNERDSLKNDNEDLRRANMKLFLKVGQKDTSDDLPQEDEQKEKRKFEDLFDEKGGIK